MTKTLRDWLPSEAHQQDLPRLKKLMDLKVDLEFSMVNSAQAYYRWPGSHKNVYAWVILEDGTAVGWNENPGVGWSFPRLPTKLVKTDVVEAHFLVAKGTPEERTVYADRNAIGITHYRPLCGKFTREHGEKILEMNANLGEGSLVVVPGITRWTLKVKNSSYARVVAEYIGKPTDV